MNKEKIKSAIIDLEDVVTKAEELHAITMLQYDSFVEGNNIGANSAVYKTIVSIIEDRARDLQQTADEHFNLLYKLMKEEGEEL